MSCVTVHRLFHPEASNLDVELLSLPCDTFYKFPNLPYNTSRSIVSTMFHFHKISLLDTPETTCIPSYLYSLFNYLEMLLVNLNISNILLL